MIGAAAASYDVTPCDGRALAPGGCRQVVSGVAIGLATLAAAGGLIVTATVVAAWIINAALATDRHIHVPAPIEPRLLALARYGPTLASAADASRSARFSTAAADAADMTFDAKWARATAFTVASAPPSVAERLSKSARNVSSPPSPPLEISDGRAKTEIARASGVTHIAALNPAAAPAPASPGSLTDAPRLAAKPADSVPLPRPNPERHETARSPAGRIKPQIAAVAPPQRAPSRSMTLPGPDSRTAVYDIGARMVYLPNGDRLEAHSGLGSKMDDPRYIHVKDRGPTPPNVYDLALREQPFHGVRAIRLKPVDDGKMFGRDGMLAHSYMLGPNGQSNGCVSFKDYQKFLQAFLSGKVDRLVVVANLGTEPVRTARARRGPVSRYALNNE